MKLQSAWGTLAQALPGGFMLYWALVFFVVSVVAAVFGFGGVADATAGIAQILFYVFLVFFVISLITGLVSGTGSRNRRTSENH